MSAPRHIPKQAGATLVELIVSIVIISVGLAGILTVMDSTTRSSGDALVQQQAIAIAEAYLEEIALKDFCDPNNAAPCAVGNAPGSPNCIVCPAAEANRRDFDNVCDYNNRTDTGARDQNGSAVAGLGSYTVETNVATNAGLDTLTGGNCEVLRVQVDVSHPFIATVTLSGHRTNY